MSKATDKRCGNCAHAMESELRDQVFCIEGPSVPVSHNGNIISAFPMMMLWGKCDRFKAGVVQKQNEAK